MLQLHFTRVCLAMALCWPTLALTTDRVVGDEIDFAHQIAPLLKRHCVECHGGAQREGAFSINTRESLLAGGESGPGMEVGDHLASELYQRVTAESEFVRMPPDGDGLSAAEAELIAAWIDRGAKWEPGFTFGLDAYEPPLRPRRPELPPARDGREHPIDRMLDHWMAENGVTPPEPISDELFLRRASLDLVGLLPTPQERQAFLASNEPDKRAEWVRTLLNRDVDYADHWLTFWNDLLRNDYTGTGFITGGRRQITSWLYDALLTNKPYDEFTRELLAPPTDASSGFAAGIRWRGEVSAGQTVEIQFAQNVGQVFLGINLKCASCHDSFIDRWKLEDAYGLAAVYAQQPLELHRCDKPIGKQAKASWLFEELGQVDPKASQPERLEQLARLMTDNENGRFARTIANRIWQRLMGRGIVHPTDAMQTEPWNEDLLDYLAVYLVDHDYDLKQLMALIATSKAYQSRVESVDATDDGQGYAYRGPRSKRLTAEQFVDCVWQLTGADPDRMDADVVRAPAAFREKAALPLAGQWIWSRADAGNSEGGDVIAVRRRWELDAVPDNAVAVVTCDNAYRLYVNGALVGQGDAWNKPDLVTLQGLRQGTNEIVIVGVNGGTGPNPAGIFFEARWLSAGGDTRQLGSDATWQWTGDLNDGQQSLPRADATWSTAAVVEHPEVWMQSLAEPLKSQLQRGLLAGGKMVRAGLVKSDFLMRSLGRPNRDQVVSVRPLELTTLEAIDLSIGETLAEYLHQGAESITAREWESSEMLVRWLYQFALTREPTTDELRLLTEAIGDAPTVSGVEDVLWALVMLPEFQIVR